MDKVILSTAKKSRIDGVLQAAGIDKGERRSRRTHRPRYARSRTCRMSRTEAIKSAGITDRPVKGGRDAHSKEFFDKIHSHGKQHDSNNNGGRKRHFENPTYERRENQGGGGGYKKKGNYNGGNNFGKRDDHRGDGRSDYGRDTGGRRDRNGGGGGHRQ